MAWQVGKKYLRGDIQAIFQSLGPRDAVARQGKQVAVVLLRNNTPGWFNRFPPGPPRQLEMEVNKNHPDHNRVLKDSKLEKLLFWSEAGTEYVYLGPIVFVSEKKDEVLKRMYVFAIESDDAPVPEA